jgi:hypothetical protein
LTVDDPGAVVEVAGLLAVAGLVPAGALLFVGGADSFELHPVKITHNKIMT